MAHHPHESSWKVLRSGQRASAYNMALDEALMLNAPFLKQPVLRFYAWRGPAATFGYFQKYSDVAKWTILRPLIRRPTGGGLVPHDADWTYSVAIPPGNPWYESKATESYRRIHAWVSAAFRKLGVETTLAPTARIASPGQCFAGYEQSDVLWHGKKIAGAAQRRTRDGLLIQGSVQPPPVGMNRGDWEKAMLDHASEKEDIFWSELAVSPELAAFASSLEEKSYSKDSYNQKR